MASIRIYREPTVVNVDSTEPSMERTYYVDQQNGDDTNDGSSSAPFQTLHQALTMVPVGGKGIINLLGPYLLPPQPHYIVNKYILLNLNGDLKFSRYVDSQARISTIALYHSHLVINGSRTNSRLFVDYSTTPPEWDSAPKLPQVMFSVNDGSQIFFQFAFSYVRPGQAVITTHSGEYLCNVEGNIGSITTNKSHNAINLVLSGGAVIKCDNFLFSSHGWGQTFSLNCSFRYGSKIVTSNGTVRSIVDVTSGIIRDSDGKPRNIISNQIF